MEQTVSPRVNPTAQPKLVPKYRAIPISQLQNGTTQKTIKLLNGTIIKGTFLKAGAIGKPITIINSNGNLRGVPLKQVFTGKIIIKLIINLIVEMLTIILGPRFEASCNRAWCSNRFGSPGIFFDKCEN